MDGPQDEDPVPTLDLIRLAEQGGAFDFWRDDGEDIYAAQVAAFEDWTPCLSR